jgi:hypothetical protein
MLATAALTLTLALGAFSATALAGGGRVAAGRTAQGKPVRVSVAGHRLKMLRFTASLRCRDGSVLTVRESGFLATPMHGRKFSDRQLGPTDTVRFKGRVSSGAVRGRLRIADRVGNVRCSSHWITFRAKMRS